MSIERSKQELTDHKQQSINELTKFLDELIQSSNPDHNKKASLLNYWIDDYVRFLKTEETFNPHKLKSYKRGDVIKVHLGFKIGSEQGGLHYAVVLDKNNNLSSPTVTIVPLTSVKPQTDLDKLPKWKIYLGNEIYNLLNVKIKMKLKAVKDKLVHGTEFSKETEDEIKREVALLESMLREISKMKQGSIALINQITTISKIRICDPKSSNNVFSGIRLSNINLDKIDKAVLSFFTKCNPE